MAHVLICLCENLSSEFGERGIASPSKTYNLNTPGGVKLSMGKGNACIIAVGAVKFSSKVTRTLFDLQHSLVDIARHTFGMYIVFDCGIVEYAVCTHSTLEFHQWAQDIPFSSLDRVFLYLI